MDGATPANIIQLLGARQPFGSPARDDEESDGHTVADSKQRNDVVLGRKKKRLVAPHDDNVEKLLLEKALDPKETFLFHKEDVHQ